MIKLPSGVVKFFNSLPGAPRFLQWGQRPYVAGPLAGVFAVALVYGCFQIYLHNRDGRANLAEGYYGVAYDQYISEAQAGSKEAQVVIGNLYYLGFGVERDQYEAARWYLKAALEGYIPAQINLGQMYWSGHGVPRNVAKSVGWYHLATKAGSQQAETYLNYIGSTNSTLPLMFNEARRQFDGLKIVKSRYAEMGEAAFLLK
ncbi:MAG: hypothetical protein DHS20C08_10250 [Rhodomicrobium sp.]|nr:MAG: hypothetical protein DHS20C08_10250 [Rhodomicrobium sp.]